MLSTSNKEFPILRDNYSIFVFKFIKGEEPLAKDPPSAQFTEGQAHLPMIVSASVWPDLIRNCILGPVHYLDSSQCIIRHLQCSAPIIS